RDDDVRHDDLEILHRLVVAVGAEGGEGALADHLAAPTLLQQVVGGAVDVLRDGEVGVVCLLDRAAACRAARRRSGLIEGVAPGKDLDFPRVVTVRRFPGDIRGFELQEHIASHKALLFLSSLSRAYAAAGGGNSATRRIDAVSSSSWKCGRRNTVAR